ncbi:hypothetical protein [Roseiterribacter gracilis]|uniref:Uncharacterized protein n=1 Tax=Roseiterribacter gracilis TaxID=2812848 RepID=A0A8S8XCZ4_9PROT|nr:hypothetical protein TMPK1_21390 [Rhodospirillales bacterium TMPK1]
MDEQDFELPTDESLLSALLVLSAAPRRSRRRYFRDDELFTMPEPEPSRPALPPSRISIREMKAGSLAARG